MTPAQGVQLDRYTLIRRLGEGGMGTVWLATDGAGGQFAVKVAFSHFLNDPYFRELFHREAEVHMHLIHPGIVPAVQLIEDSVLALVLEFIDGPTLEERIYGRGVDDCLPEVGTPLPVDEALGIGIEVLHALDFAHQKGYVHRDVKPSNILLDQSGRAHLTDFGIVRNIRSVRKTRTGTAVAASLPYMSPEQVSRPKDVTHRSDVYSFGCVLYDMLTGRPPFLLSGEEQEADADFLYKQKHLSVTPAAPHTLNRDIPLQLSNIIMRTLEKNPDDRYPGCGTLAQALQQVRDHLADTGGYSAGVEPQSNHQGLEWNPRALNVDDEEEAQQSRKKWWMFGSMIAAAALILVAAFSFSSNKTTTEKTEVAAPAAPATTTIPEEPKRPAPDRSSFDRPSPVIAPEPQQQRTTPPDPPVRKRATNNPTPPTYVAPSPNPDPPTSRAEGSIVVTSVPSGLPIYVNDVLRSERTPATLRLEPGHYKIRVSTVDGSLAQESDVNLQTQMVNLRITLIGEH